MFSSVSARKFARLAVSTGVAGATVVLVFLGGPAEAASAAGRGMNVVLGGRGM